MVLRRVSRLCLLVFHSLSSTHRVAELDLGKRSWRCVFTSLLFGPLHPIYPPSTLLDLGKRPWRCVSFLGLYFPLLHLFVIWESGHWRVSLSRLCLLALHNLSSYSSSYRTWSGKASMAVPLFTSLFYGSPHPIYPPSTLQCLIWERPWRCVPFSTLSVGSSLSILLFCQSTHLIWESGHRGASSFQVYFCENHARKMRTFFTRRLEPKTRSSYHIKWSNAKWNTLKQNTSSLLKTKLS